MTYQYFFLTKKTKANLQKYQQKYFSEGLRFCCMGKAKEAQKFLGKALILGHPKASETLIEINLIEEKKKLFLSKS